MDANVLNFLISLAAGVGANVTTAAFQKVLGARPGFDSELFKARAIANRQDTI